LKVDEDMHALEQIQTAADSALEPVPMVVRALDNVIGGFENHATQLEPIKSVGCHPAGSCIGRWHYYYDAVEH